MQGSVVQAKTLPTAAAKKVVVASKMSSALKMRWKTPFTYMTECSKG